MSFANPLILLIGLPLAILVPILIHLFNRTKYFRTDWAAMEFLLNAFKKTRKRVRIENLLLLFLRILILCFIVGMLSGPTVAGTVPIPKSTHLVIVIDDSYSMSASAEATGDVSGDVTDYGDNTVLSNALRVLGEALQPPNIRKGDAMTCIRTSETLGDYFRSETASDDVAMSSTAARALFTTAHDAVLTKIASTRPSYHEPDWLHTYTLVRDALRATGDEFEVKQVVIVTDLQKRNFEGIDQNEDAYSKVLEEILESTDDHMDFLDFSTPRSRNLAITDARLLNQVVGAGVELQLVVTIADYSTYRDSANSKVELKYSIDNGAPRKLKEITGIEPIIDGGKPYTESITKEDLVINEPGTHRIKIELPEDDLAADNAFYLVVDVIEDLSMLLVEGDPYDPGDETRDKTKTETFVLEVLFARVLSRPGRDKTRITGTAVDYTNLSGVDFNRYDGVLLANVPSLQPPTIAALTQYVRAGNPLIVSLGDKVLENFYNEDMYGAGLIPVPLVKRAGAQDPMNPGPNEYYTMEVVDTEYPAIKNLYLEGQRRENPINFIGAFKAYGFYSVDEAKAESDVSTPLRLRPFQPTAEELAAETSYPLVVVRPLGRGEVTMITSTVDISWNNLVTGTKMFITFWQEMVESLANTRTRHRQLHVGDTYRRPITAAVYADKNTVFRPGESIDAEGAGKPVPVLDDPEAKASGFLGFIGFDETDVPGFYTLRLAKASKTLARLLEMVLSDSTGLKPDQIKPIVKRFTDAYDRDPDSVFRADKINELLRPSFPEPHQRSIHAASVQVGVAPMQSAAKREVIDYFAVNIKTEESNLEKLEDTTNANDLTRAVRAALRLGDDVNVQATHISRADQYKEPNIKPKESRIWQYIAFAVLVLMALEMFFAMMFTSRQRSS